MSSFYLNIYCTVSGPETSYRLGLGQFMESPVKGAVFLAGIQIILCTLKGTPRVGSYFFLGYTIYTYDCGEERPASSPDPNSTAVNYKN